MVGLKLGMGSSGGAAFSAAAGGSSFASQWTDTFTRANSTTMGGDWTEGNSGEPGFEIASNKLNHDGNFNNAWATAGGDATGSSKDRYAFQISINPASWSNAGFCMGIGDGSTPANQLDFGDTAMDWYHLEPTGASSLRLMRNTSSGLTQLAVFSTGDLSGAEHIYYLEVDFSSGDAVFIVKVDGSEPTLSSGSLTDTGPLTALQTTAQPIISSTNVGATTYDDAEVWY